MDDYITYLASKGRESTWRGTKSDKIGHARFAFPHGSKEVKVSKSIFYALAPLTHIDRIPAISERKFSRAFISNTSNPHNRKG